MKSLVAFCTHLIVLLKYHVEIKINDTFVNGHSRVPKPPARMIPFIFTSKSLSQFINALLNRFVRKLEIFLTPYAINTEDIINNT